MQAYSSITGSEKLNLMRNFIEGEKGKKSFRSRITGQIVSIPDSTLGYAEEIAGAVEMKLPSYKEATKKMYEIELNDSIYLNGYSITRVPGGWIYDRPNGPVFVPFNNEGQNEQLKL